MQALGLAIDTSPDNRGRLEHAQPFDTDEMMGSGSKPPEEGAGVPTHACQPRRTSPISSLTGAMGVTFATVTAAHQNNTYYSCTFPGITWEPKKRVPGKTDRLHPVSVTSGFWVKCINLSAARCNRIFPVSYNMSDEFKEKWAQKDTALTYKYHISILSP